MNVSSSSKFREQHSVHITVFYLHHYVNFYEPIDLFDHAFSYWGTSQSDTDRLCGDGLVRSQTRVSIALSFAR